MDLPASYDAVAEEYAARIYDELRYKPLDRELLDAFAEEVRGRGTVCDLGCGPGHVARYLADRGVEAFGIDISPGMIAVARRLNPDAPFECGDMTALDLQDGSLAGAVAFYSLLHLERERMPHALQEIARVLQPDGLLLVAFHVGGEVKHLDEWWGHAVSLDFAFFESGEMTAWLEAAGFEVRQSIERDPYPDVEYPSRRAYVVARTSVDGSSGR